MDELKQKVQEALANAKDNGYTFEGTALEIAEDMVTFDAALENEDPAEIARIIEEVQK